MSRQQPEWRVEDVALLDAALEVVEAADEPRSYGLPVSDAYDSETDPDNPDAQFALEPYFYKDNAAAVVRRYSEKYKKAYGEDSLDDVVIAVKKVPKEPPTGD